jgi:hypothetical protein
MDATIEEVPALPVRAPYSLWQLVRYMLGLGKRPLQAKEETPLAARTGSP